MNAVSWSGDNLNCCTGGCLSVAGESYCKCQATSTAAEGNVAIALKNALGKHGGQQLQGELESWLGQLENNSDVRDCR